MMKNTIRNVKIRKQNDGYFYLDYGKLKEPAVFRYYILKSIIQNADKDVFIMADTNQRITENKAEWNEEWLKQQPLRYNIMPAQSNPQYPFSIKINIKSDKKAAKTEKRIVIALDEKAFTREIFMLIENNDVSIGLGSKKTFEEICEAYRQGGEKMLFDPLYFCDSLYDSVICARLRSTFDIAHHLEAVNNEMDL